MIYIKITQGAVTKYLSDKDDTVKNIDGADRNCLPYLHKINNFEFKLERARSKFYDVSFQIPLFADGDSVANDFDLSNRLYSVKIWIDADDLTYFGSDKLIYDGFARATAYDDRYLSITLKSKQYSESMLTQADDVDNPGVQTQNRFFPYTFGTIKYQKALIMDSVNLDYAVADSQLWVFEAHDDGVIVPFTCASLDTTQTFVNYNGFSYQKTGVVAQSPTGAATNNTTWTNVAYNDSYPDFAGLAKSAGNGYGFRLQSTPTGREVTAKVKFNNTAANSQQNVPISTFVGVLCDKLGISNTTSGFSTLYPNYSLTADKPVIDVINDLCEFFGVIWEIDATEVARFVKRGSYFNLHEIDDLVFESFKVQYRDIIRFYKTKWNEKTFNPTQVVLEDNEVEVKYPTSDYFMGITDKEVVCFFQNNTTSFVQGQLASNLASIYNSFEEIEFEIPDIRDIIIGDRTNISTTERSGYGFAEYIKFDFSKRVTKIKGFGTVARL